MLLCLVMVWVVDVCIDQFVHWLICCSHWVIGWYWFLWLTDALRDSSSNMSVTAGAPDPTFGDVHGEKSQWQLSVDELESRLTKDLESMTHSRLCFDYSTKRSKYVRALVYCSLSHSNTVTRKLWDCEKVDWLIDW